jgi:parallel beta-helix repeat protein
MNTVAAWRAGVASDPGLQRTHNEDRVFVDEEAGVFLVVDGVGGQAAGEHAAEIAVRVISESLARAAGAVEECLRESITAANNQIFELAQTHPKWKGMACVLTLAIAREDRMTVGHVGDSRLYLAWDGKLRKLTSDHSPVGEREDQGEISEEEAMRHPSRNQVFRDVGSRRRDADDGEFIEIRSFPFHPDAAFLLCSDGLSDTVSSSQISAIVETYDGDAARVSGRLVEAANHAGGKDNISVVFVAGPEFVGTESLLMRQARSRHAVTRVRRGARWRSLSGRAIWFAAGLLAGPWLWKFAVPRHPRVELVNASDPSSISKALGRARPGDTIEVPPGEFRGPVELRDGVNLISQKTGTAIIRGAVSAHGIKSGRFSGFSIAGSVLLDDAAMEIDDVEVTGSSGCGVRIQAGSISVLRANFIHDNAGCGISIGGASSPRLTGNRISENGKAGIEIQPFATPEIENNIIVDNAIPEEAEPQLSQKNVVKTKPEQP